MKTHWWPLLCFQPLTRYKATSRAPVSETIKLIWRTFRSGWPVTIWRMSKPSLQDTMSNTQKRLLQQLVVPIQKVKDWFSRRAKTFLEVRIPIKWRCKKLIGFRMRFWMAIVIWMWGLERARLNTKATRICQRPAKSLRGSHKTPYRLWNGSPCCARPLLK